MGPVSFPPNDFTPDPDRPGYFITESGMRGAPAEEIMTTIYEFNPKTVEVTQEDADELLGLLDVALAAADGDSNDEEIEALQEVRDFIVALLGVKEVED